MEYTGYWEKYFYNPYGRRNKVVMQYLDHSPSSADNLNRVRFIYEGVYNPQVTERETLLGQEVSCTYVAHFGLGERWDIQGVRPWAGWSAADNQITKTFTHTSGDFMGEVHRVEHSDGRLTLITYAIDSGKKTVVSSTGAPNGDRSADESCPQGKCLRGVMTHMGYFYDAHGRLAGEVDF